MTISYPTTSRTIYVQPGLWYNGDGSSYSPFNNLPDAVDKAKSARGGVIQLYPGNLAIPDNYVIDGNLGGSEIMPLRISAAVQGTSALTNFRKLTIQSCSLGLNNVSLNPLPETDEAILIKDSAWVKIENCVFTEFNTSAVNDPAVTFHIRNSKNVEFSKCDFNLGAVTANLNAIVKITDGSTVTFNDCNVTNVPENVDFIRQEDLATSLRVWRCNFYRVSIPDELATSVAVHVIGVSNDTAPSECIVGNSKFSNLAHGVRFSSPNDGAAIAFMSGPTGSQEARALILYSSFIGCTTGIEHAVQGSVAVYNCTFHGNLTGIAASNDGLLSAQNNIFTLNTTAAISATGGAVYVAYSDFFDNINNAGVLQDSDIQCGPFIRFIDPYFNDAGAGDLELQPASDLIYSGIPGLPYLPEYPNVGNSTAVRTPRDTEVNAVMLHENTQLLEEYPPSAMSTADYIHDRLRAQVPQISLDPGNAISDLFVAPTGLIVEGLVRRIDSVVKSTSIAFAKSMTRSELDAMASNYFVFRNKGTKATGAVRIYLYAPLPVVVPAITYFYTADSKEYICGKETSYTTAEILENIDAETGYFYADIPVEAAVAGDAMNIGVGEIVSTTLDISVLKMAKMTNPAPMSGGKNAETPTELINRIYRSASIRGNSTAHAIRASISDNFTEAIDIEVIGQGHELMLRDYDTVSGRHLGSTVDAHIAAKTLYTAYLDIQMPALGSSYGTSYNMSTAPLPLMLTVNSIEEIADRGGAAIKDLTLTDIRIHCPEPEWRFSGEETMVFEPQKEELFGSWIRIHYTGSKLVSEINEFFKQEANKPICYDILVKHFIPVVVDVEATHYSTANADDMTLVISEYIKSIPAGSALDIGQMLSAIAAYGINNIDLPVTLNARYHRKTTTTPATRTSTSKLSAAALEKFIPGTITLRYVKR